MLDKEKIVKSVTPTIKDENVVREAGSTGFCSWGRLVEDYLNADPNYNGRILGVRASEQGLEILFK